MATQQTKAQAAKTSQAARRTAQSAQKTTRGTKDTTRQAERTLRALVTDGAYAAVGVGDSAVGVLKGVPRRLERLRKDAPRGLETGAKDVEQRMRGLWAETPNEVRSRLTAARKEAEKEFDAYADRGRTVVRSISSSTATRRAVEQTRTARSQVKAATTSVRKAVRQSVAAAESAAERVGD